MFTSEKPEVSHLKTFGCVVYLHVPKEKRSKLDPSRKKGIFVGYSDQSKAYKIYIPCFRKSEVSRDVTFDEYVSFNKHRNTHVDEEEQEAPKIIETSKPPVRAEEDPILEGRDMEEPQELIETPHDTMSTRKILTWARNIIE